MTAWFWIGFSYATFIQFWLVFLLFLTHLIGLENIQDLASIQEVLAPIPLKQTLMLLQYLWIELSLQIIDLYLILIVSIYISGNDVFDSVILANGWLVCILKFWQIYPRWIRAQSIYWLSVSLIHSFLFWHWGQVGSLLVVLSTDSRLWGFFV